jgi:hypothetical protein
VEGLIRTTGPEKSRGKGDSFDACSKRVWAKADNGIEININTIKR